MWLKLNNYKNDNTNHFQAMLLTKRKDKIKERLREIAINSMDLIDDL